VAGDRHGCTTDPAEVQEVVRTRCRARDKGRRWGERRSGMRGSPQGTQAVNTEEGLGGATGLGVAEGVRESEKAGCMSSRLG
jgi:hypothetical protein